MKMNNTYLILSFKTYIRDDYYFAQFRKTIKRDSLKLTSKTSS